MRHLHAALKWSLALLLLGPAFADAQVNLRRPPTLLSKAELRACILREDELKAREVSFEAAQMESQTSLTRLSEEANALAEVLRSIDATDEAAVAAYNARNEARNVSVEIHNKRAQALNQAIAQRRAEHANYLEACAARPYSFADKNAVLRELGRLPEKEGQRSSPSMPKSDGAGTRT